MLDSLHAKMAFQSFIVGCICLGHFSCYFTLDFPYGSYLFLEYNTQSGYATPTEAWPIINKKQAAYIMSFAGETSYIPASYLRCTWQYIAFVPWHYWLLFSPKVYNNPWLPPPSQNAA